jgi:hypothetical protein
MNMYCNDNERGLQILTDLYVSGHLNARNGFRYAVYSHYMKNKLVKSASITKVSGTTYYLLS